MNNLRKNIIKFFRFGLGLLEEEKCDIEELNYSTIAELSHTDTYTLEEAARKLGISRRTLSTRISNGDLEKPLKVAGGKKFYTKKYIDSILLNNN